MPELCIYCSILSKLCQDFYNASDIGEFLFGSEYFYIESVSGYKLYDFIMIRVLGYVSEEHYGVVVGFSRRSSDEPVIAAFKLDIALRNKQNIRAVVLQGAENPLVRRYRGGFGDNKG